jgi:predicted Abi (CAAX) family protease
MVILMTQVVLTALLVAILHASGAFESFLVPTRDLRCLTRLVVYSLAHAFAEEYVFRALYWKRLGNATAQRTTYLWLNVSIFWVMHVALLQCERHAHNGAAAQTYSSASYQLSIVFAALLFNAVYLDSGVSRPLLTTALLHAALLVAWGIFGGGNEDTYYEKYTALAREMRRRTLPAVRP